MKMLEQKKQNFNKEYRLKLKIECLTLIESLYWSGNYTEIKKLEKRYHLIDNLLKKCNNPMTIIIQFISAKKLCEMIEHDYKEDKMNIPHYELTVEKLNEIALIKQAYVQR